MTPPFSVGVSGYGAGGGGCFVVAKNNEMFYKNNNEQIMGKEGKHLADHLQLVFDDRT